MGYVEELGKKAKSVERSIATAEPKQKNDALKAIAKNLIERADFIIAENKKDLETLFQSL